MIALAFRELAENAAKIGELNITPDLLRSLLRPRRRRGGESLRSNPMYDKTRSGHPSDPARGADRAVQHPGPGAVLPRARRRGLRRRTSGSTTSTAARWTRSGEHSTSGSRCQFLDRGLVPTYTFDRTEVVVTLGQDGLVANTAKYAGGQPIVGLNPDPARVDGVLLPFGVAAARSVVGETLRAGPGSGRSRWRRRCWPMASGCSPSTTSSSARGPTCPPAIGSAPLGQAKRSLPAGSSSRPGRGRPAGCRRCSTWPPA